MADYLLCIYPVLLIILLVFGAKIAPKDTFHQDFLSLKYTKVLQGAAAVGIILHHLVQEVTNYGGIHKGPITHMNWMGVLFTSVFFFFSGYGLLKSYQSKPDYLDNFLEKRIPSVLIPFLVSNVIYFYFVGLYSGKIIRVTDVVTCLTGFTLLNTNTWFLVEILLFYLLFYMIYKRIKNPNIAFGTMTGAVLTIIVISLLLGHDNSEMNGHWFMGEWWYNSTIVFVMGMLVARFEMQVVGFAQKNYKWLLPVVVILFLSVYSLSEYVVQNLGYYREWEGHPGYIEKAITAIVQSLAGCFFMAVIGLICMKVRFYNIIIAYVGKISLALYIIHDVMKRNVLYMFDKMPDPGFFLVVLIYSFVVASILHFLINQKLIELWMNIREGRNLEPETLEAKIKWKKRKEREKKLKVFGSILGLVLIACMGKDAYDKYIVPGKNYEEQVAVLATAQVGDIIYYGTYDIEPLITGERIQWYVADRKEDKVLLISVKGLAGASYQQAYEATCWESSTIRKFLNEEFFKKAFTEDERELIVTTKIETPDNSMYGTDGGSFAYDKVFLLSVEEAQLYYTDEETRQLNPTNMARRKGMNVNPNTGSGWWWLRTMGKVPDMAAVVSVDGEINMEGERVNIISGGVRPAMWVECK